MPPIKHIKKYEEPVPGSVWKNKLYGDEKFKFKKVGKSQSEKFFWWEFEGHGGSRRYFDPADCRLYKRKQSRAARRGSAIEELPGILKRKPKILPDGKELY